MATYLLSDLGFNNGRYAAHTPEDDSWQTAYWNEVLARNNATLVELRDLPPKRPPAAGTASDSRPLTRERHRDVRLGAIATIQRSVQQWCTRRTRLNRRTTRATPQPTHIDRLHQLVPQPTYIDRLTQLVTTLCRQNPLTEADAQYKTAIIRNLRLAIEIEGLRALMPTRHQRQLDKLREDMVFGMETHVIQWNPAANKEAINKITITTTTIRWYNCA